MNYLIRVRDGVSVGTVITDHDPDVFTWPDDETIEVFTDAAEFDARLVELTPVTPPVLSVADRLDAIEIEIRGMKERAAAEAAKATPTAKEVAAAIARDAG